MGAVKISRRRRALRDREEWFRRLADDTPAYLWLTSTSDSANTFVNRSFKEFLGTPDDLTPDAFSRYVHPDDASRAEAAFRDCVAHRRKYSDEFRMRRADGEYRWVFSQGTPRFSSSGEFLGYTGALLDITDRKHTEEQVHALTARLIDAQEEERSRIARELHDDLSQQIAAVSIGISNMKREIGTAAPAARQQADRLQQRLAELAEGIRRLSHELHSPVLEHSGLPAAVRAWCSEFSRLTGLRVTFRTMGAFDDVSRAAALCLYRVAQESLQNVAKHARTWEAVVELSRTHDEVRIAVSDSGRGMDLSLATDGSGLGLASIRERVRLLNGTAEFDSSPGQGTTITVVLPLSAPSA